jgi:hypothetical protein
MNDKTVLTPILPAAGGPPPVVGQAVITGLKQLLTTYNLANNSKLLKRQNTFKL